MARALFAVLAVAQVVYGRAAPEPRGAARREAATRGIVGLFLATSLADAVAARGRGRGVALLGSAGAAGFGVELLGVATGRPFGHNAYGGGLGRRWRGVPL